MRRCWCPNVWAGCVAVLQRSLDAPKTDRQVQILAIEEEEEDSEDAASDKDGGQTEAAVKAAPGANGTQSAVQALLNNLRRGYVPADKSPPSPVDNTLELLRDFAALSRARERLLSSSQDKSLDVIFRARCRECGRSTTVGGIARCLWDAI